ncbi:MAG: UDP-N-acetylmuramoyl-tripeptide--D-alanyl-D-alanine ligase [Pseudomonadota bacterium]
MTALWTSADIAAATGGKASADFAIGGVAFDSREIGPGDLFVAMPGTAFDGHQFLDTAFSRGAAGAIVSQPIAQPHVLVEDTAAALNALGVASRGRTTARVAGVTGSVGKTGTKEALAAALARKPGTRVHRSVKSYNNHTGVPLSLSRMPADSDYGVFEMGMNHAGEISGLTRMVRPHVAVITTIAPAHIEFFPTGLDGIADAKGEIFEGLEPGGTAVIPFDSPQRDRLIQHAKVRAANIVTFGLGEGADVRAREVIDNGDNSTVTAMMPGVELCLTIGQAGAHWVSNGLAVLAAVQALGGDLGIAALALGDMAQLAGRGARVKVRIGDGEALLIDESYNANPTSMRATLAVLARERGRKVAVLGEMRELGARGAELHAGLADDVVAAGVGSALLVGDAMLPLADALDGRIDVNHVADTKSAIAALADTAAPGDAILVKGSNGVGLSALVAHLTTGNA